MEFLLFFSNGEFPSGIFKQLFQNSFIFGEGTYYFGASISSEQLLFKELHFRKSHFLAVVIFSEYLVFRNETEQPHFENRKFFRVVAFRNSYIFGEVIG